MIAELLGRGGLSLDRLQSFCLVARAGGVTKAARADAARQSLFSRQIRELEEFFGVELIRRKGRGIVLTVAGQRLNTLAIECFASLMDFKSDCRGLPVEVVIGAGESVIEWVLMPSLVEVRRRLPHVRLRFLNLATSEVVLRLADGVLDYGVVRKDAVVSPLHVAPLGVMEYSLFIPEGVGGSSAGAELLGAVPLATLEGEGSFRKALSAIARRRRLDLKVEIECSSFPLVARAVGTGAVAAILPSMAARDLAPRGAREVKHALFDGLRREMCLAWNPRAMKIRPALDKARSVFEQAFKAFQA